MYRDHEPKSKHKNLPNPKTEPSEASNSNPAATVNHHLPEDHQPIQQVDFDFMKKAFVELNFVHALDFKLMLAFHFFKLFIFPHKIECLLLEQFIPSFQENLIINGFEGNFAKLKKTKVIERKDFFHRLNLAKYFTIADIFIGLIMLKQM